LLLPAILSLGLLADARAQEADAQRELLARQLPGWLEQSATPSAAIARVSRTGVHWTLVDGEQSAGTPATDNTLYNVASLTKPITAEITLRLASAKRFGIDARLAEHWIDPDLVGDPNLDRLTPKLCLSHQCGFPNWRHDTDDHLSIQWTPGSRPGYSGEGYEYVARYLQARTGSDLQALATELLFEPARMQRSSYVTQAWFDGKVAVPRGPDGETGTPSLRTTPSAADDLHATVGDYGRFAASVLGAKAMSPVIAEQRWNIDHDMSEQVCQPGRLEGSDCPKRMGFALGWVRFETATDTVFFHGGGDWGERAFVLLVPERDLGIVVFTNGAGGMAVIRDVISALYPNPQLSAFLRMQAGG
jgi:CubicO group peptidase (beta-lactamase class C family)